MTQETVFFLTSGINNSGNLKYDSSSNRFVCSILGGGLKVDQNSVACLSSFQISYSWRNITAALLNNTFSYTFNGTLVNLTIPDGSYTYPDLQGYLETQMFSNGHYLLMPDGTPSYFISIDLNVPLYAISITLKKIPTSLPVGWTNPSSISLSGNTPSITLPNTKILQLLGFASAGTYGPYTSTQIVTGTQPPVISPYSSIIVSLSGINQSSISNNPSAILQTFPNASYGNLLSFSSQGSEMWLPFASGTYTELSFSILNDENRKYELVDTNQVSMVLKIKKLNQ